MSMKAAHGESRAVVLIRRTAPQQALGLDVLHALLVGCAVSMNGEYVRVTADELARVINDPVWALAFVDAV